METVSKRYHWHLVGLVICLIANIWLRWPATQTNGFHNEDVAGIAYSAQLLHQGGLPLIDTLELKAPGSFFLTALIWSISPMTISALQCAGDSDCGAAGRRSQPVCSVLGKIGICTYQYVAP